MYLQQFIKPVNCFHLHLQVAFDHFYDTTASSDKCTLCADRNCVNRRNVTCEVDKNFSACKQFFKMEVEARVIAAALDHMNLTAMNDKPSEDILPSTLIDDASEVQKQFLKSLVCNIVDKYIVNQDSIHDCIKEIENHSRYSLMNIFFYYFSDQYAILAVECTLLYQNLDAFCLVLKPSFLFLAINIWKCVIF